MGPLRKKGRGAGGGKTEALAPGEELPGISPELDNNKVRSVTMNGRKESITKSSSSAAFESLNAASRFGLSVRVSNQRKSEPTSSENTPRYSTSLFCTPETFFLLPVHCMLLPGLGFLIVFYARAQESSATELEWLALSRKLFVLSSFLLGGWWFSSPSFWVSVQEPKEILQCAAPDRVTSFGFPAWWYIARKMT